MAGVGRNFWLSALLIAGLVAGAVALRSAMWACLLAALLGFVSFGSMRELCAQQAPALQELRTQRAAGATYFHVRLAKPADLEAAPIEIGSALALQHVPSPATALGYIAEFLRVVRPGSFAVFQVPERIPWLYRLQGRRRAFL